MEMITSLNLINVLALALFANWITHWFTPLNYFREVAIDVWTKATIKAGFYPLQRLAVVISCPKCFGFWFTLIAFQNFWLALIVSFVAYLINFIIERIERYGDESM